MYSGVKIEAQSSQPEILCNHFNTGTSDISYLFHFGVRLKRTICDFAQFDVMTLNRLPVQSVFCGNWYFAKFYGKKLNPPPETVFFWGGGGGV